MIQWKKYDPKNPPELGKEYLVSDGNHVTFAYIHNHFDEIIWYTMDMSQFDGESVTYYAEINLPELKKKEDDQSNKF